jgi:hypothetical protein
LVLLLVATVSVLAGCGGGSTFDVQNPPPPPPSDITVAFQPAPVGSLLISDTTQLIAVISNDPGNYGVDWSVTCQNTNHCGSLDSYHSASGQAVTYTPPQSLRGNAESVNIVAFASADHTKNVVAPINITAFGSVLGGTYAFQTKGIDSNLQPYQLAGVIVLDGDGGITSGQQTLNYVFGSLTTAITQESTYFVGPDGRGTLTIKTSDQSGQPVTEIFSLVVLSGSQALLAELDTPQSSAGTLDLQTSTAAPTGGYAFVVSGTDSTGIPTAFGGVINIDSPGNISGQGSLADQDYNLTLSTCPAPHGLSGTVSQPDPNPFGVVTFSLTGPSCFGSVQFTGYIVDATHINLIETDNSGSSGFSTSGIAVSQGAAAGTFGLASFSGTYVWGVLGTDMNSGVPSSLTSAGVVAADGAGTLTNGFTDTSLLLNALGEPSQISAQFDGTYTVTPIGRVTLALHHLSPAPNPLFRARFIFYLTANGQPALVLESGGEDPNYPSLGAGIAYPQAAPPLAFSGKYGVGFTQQNGGENDGTGQMTADATAQPPLFGAVDDSNLGIGNSIQLNDTFAVPDSYGRVAGTFLGTAVEYYLVDSTHGFFVETDLADPNAPSGQVALGRFAVRTPVCAGCP